MYNYFQGPLAELTPTQAVIDCGGVGYLIEISLNTYETLQNTPEGATVKLLVHEVIREDEHLLFGFYEEAEREMFRMLIAVNGVGVQTARVMLSTLTVDELKQAIATQDVKRVQKIKGIGAKTAQRIVLELQDKVATAGTATPQLAFNVVNTHAEEALSAMVMLGFPKSAADKVVQALVQNNPAMSVEDIIKEALKRM